MQSNKHFTICLALALFPIVSLMVWLATARLVVWWWFELFLTRDAMSSGEAMATFLAVAGLSITAIPNFFWAPVLLYKDLRWYYRYQIDLSIYR